MRRSNVIITKMLLPVLLLAHGGFDHVLGTVVKVEHNVMTVHTAKGDVAVRLDAQTELTKGDRKASPDELLRGARVVVDVPEGTSDRIAHSIKIGAGSPEKK